MRAPDDCDQLFPDCKCPIDHLFRAVATSLWTGVTDKNLVLCNDRLDDAGDGGLAERVPPWGDHGAAPGEGLSPGIVERVNARSLLLHLFRGAERWTP